MVNVLRHVAECIKFMQTSIMDCEWLAVLIFVMTMLPLFLIYVLLMSIASILDARPVVVTPVLLIIWTVLWAGEISLDMTFMNLAVLAEDIILPLLLPIRVLLLRLVLGYPH